MFDQQINEENLENPVKSDLTNSAENPINQMGLMFSENMPKAQSYTKPELDPDKFVLDDSGKPRLNKYGKPAKKPGRPKKHGEKLEGRQVFKAKVLSFEDALEKQKQAEARKIQNKQHAKATAIVCVQASISTAIMILGEDWKASSEAETDALIDATACYFEAKGVTDIPPGAALSLAVLAYAMPRIAKPQTQSRLEKIKQALVSKFGHWFGMQPKKPSIPSRSEIEAATREPKG